MLRFMFGLFFMILFLGLVRLAVQVGYNALSGNDSVVKVEDRLNDYFTSTSTWKEFVSTEGNFSASFPAYPSHDTKQLNMNGVSTILNVEMYYAVSSEGTYYSVSYTDYPLEVDTSIPKRNLEGALNGTLQAIEGGVLATSSLQDFGNHKAMAYIINENDGSLIVGENIMVGHRMYTLAIGFKQADASTTLARAALAGNFRKSFRLLNENNVLDERVEPQDKPQLQSGTTRAIQDDGNSVATQIGSGDPSDPFPYGNRDAEYSWYDRHDVGMAFRCYETQKPGCTTVAWKRAVQGYTLTEEERLIEKKIWCENNAKSWSWTIQECLTMGQNTN